MGNDYATNKKSSQIIFTTLLTFMIMGLILVTGGAVKAANGPSFYISLVPTANQLAPGNNYFLIKVGEKHQQEIQLRVYNQSSKPLTLRQQIITAYTNENGFIGYQPTQKPITFDKTLKYKLGDLVTLVSPEQFTVKGNSSTVVRAKINSTLPADFHGEVLGSWYVVQDGGNADKIQSNVSINNDYAYVTSIGLLKDNSVLPDMKLLSARGTIRNVRPGVGITLQNPKPGLMQPMSMNAKVIRLKDHKEVLSQDSTGLSMAPNSNFEYFIGSGKESLAPGKYQAVVDAKSGMQYWHLTKDFEITSQQATKINKEAVIKAPFPWAWVIVTSILGLAILVLFWILWKRRKQEQATDDL